jgi:mono/diheme cytochrome c family protein
VSAERIRRSGIFATVGVEEVSSEVDPSLKDPLVKRGKEVFEARCQVCHGAYSKNPSQGSSIYASPEMPGQPPVGLDLCAEGQVPAHPGATLDPPKR